MVSVYQLNARTPPSHMLTRNYLLCVCNSTIIALLACLFSKISILLVLNALHLAFSFASVSCFFELKSYLHAR